jgi:TPR repeat protein
MQILRPLADQGDGMAEIIVGNMYKLNFGVPLDYVTAYMWYSLAASHGNSLGAFLLTRMTPPNDTGRDRRSAETRTRVAKYSAPEHLYKCGSLVVRHRIEQETPHTAMDDF